MRPLALFLATALVGTAAVPKAELDAVRQLLSERKLDDAAAAASKLVAAYPQEAEAHVAVGRVLLAKRDTEAALKPLERAVELAPNDPAVLAQYGFACMNRAGELGMSFKALGLAKKGRTTLEKAVELNPKDIAARQTLLGFYQQAPGIAGGDLGKAYAHATEIKKLNPDQGRLAFAQLYATEKKWTEAFTEFEEVLKADPENYLANFQIGRLAALSGERVDRGLETLRKALTLKPTPGAAGHEAAHWRFGMLLEKKGDKAGAKAAYEAALKVNPKFPQALEALKKLG